MRNQRLVSAVQAVPRKTQHKKPCADCPWARTALHGWLGELSREEWVQVAHGEGTADCHTVGNQQCAGLAIYRANVAKAPRDPDTLRLPADREKVFATPQEFLNHHEHIKPGDGARHIKRLRAKGQ